MTTLTAEGINYYTPDQLDEVLPRKLLGLCCAFKPELNASPEQLTYGCTLALPGQLFCPQPQRAYHPAYKQQLVEQMNDLRAIPPGNNLQDPILYLKTSLKQKKYFSGENPFQKTCHTSIKAPSLYLATHRSTLQYCEDATQKS